MRVQRCTTVEIIDTTCVVHTESSTRQTSPGPYSEIGEGGLAHIPDNIRRCVVLETQARRKSKKTDNVPTMGVRTQST